MAERIREKTSRQHMSRATSAEATGHGKKSLAKDPVSGHSSPFSQSVRVWKLPEDARPASQTAISASPQERNDRSGDSPGQQFEAKSAPASAEAPACSNARMVEDNLG